MSDAHDRGLEAFDRRKWADAYEHLAAADREEGLEPGALEPLSVAAYLLGRPDESVDVLGRAHQEYLDRGDPVGAARCAFWLGFQLLTRGEHARGGGWVARAERLLDDCGRDCEERGFVLLPQGLRLLAQGDLVAAQETFAEAGRCGERFGSGDLMALSRLGRGQALVRSGVIEDGLALLDEAMAAVDAGGLGPVAVGIVYCAVIETCHDICDLGRAKEWTAALTDWCASQPELVPFRGECLVRRSEILRLQGNWPEALEEARRASQLLSGPPPAPAAGAAFYEQAELHRLRGDFQEAEEAYREASRRGRTPQPGLACLRLAQGRIEDAAAAIRRGLEEADTPAKQWKVLPAYVEITLAAGDLDAARDASERLAGIAQDLGAPLLRAQAASARGAVHLEEGDARAAVSELRAARTTWGELDAPYEAARTQVLLARAGRALGDEDTAEMELDGAVRILERLGAEADLAGIASMRVAPAPQGRSASGDGHGLTSREMEVLRRVASGATNRGIGEELFISERTVERHVSHIFAKLRVSSRAAATAYAYEHGLV
jgi:DNA-binding CsgD family transcriptional regulator/tetratricopeptide (TPR) repeat protein